MFIEKIIEIDTKLKIHYKKTTKRLIRSKSGVILSKSGVILSKSGVILSKSGVILAKTGENVLTLLPQMARNTPLTEFFVEAI